MMAFVLLLFALTALVNQASCLPHGDIPTNVGIIGGHNIHIEGAPYMASLRLNGTHHWCGASIIHEQFVLTAAHCIIPNREFKVLVGTDNINGAGELIDIEKIDIHKRYNNKTFNNDFCLIKLKKQLTFGPKVAKINLPATDQKVPRDTELNVTGWGSTGSHAVSPKLLQVEVPAVGLKKCKVYYMKHKYVITSNMVCAGNRGHDSCQGDSGGPLTLGDVLVGVTSFGIGCGVMPGVYARVSTVVPWITEKINLLK